jgi:hypothetical protein
MQLGKLGSYYEKQVLSCKTDANTDQFDQWLTFEKQNRDPVVLERRRAGEAAVATPFVTIVQSGQPVDGAAP